MAAFPENYNLVLGTFIGTSPYPTSYKIISKPEEDSISISLSKIPKGTTSIRLCLTDKVENKSIYSFYQYPLSNNVESDIDISGEEVDLAPFGRVQSQVFSQCLFCHGSGSSVSGNLKLTESDSYIQLINIPSVVNTSKNRVTPGNILSSFLIDVMDDEISPVSYDHKKISTLKVPDDVILIKTWVQNGATNN
jgi:hypothetical protein